MTKRKSILVLLLIIGSFFYFWLQAALFLDPDYGWHLRMGQLILKSGVPHTDPFSYTMPSYPSVDHEWLTDVFIAELLPLIGYNGLAALFALLAVSALLLQVRMLPTSVRQFVGIPLLLTVGTLAFVVGIRPQFITLFFFSLLFTLVRNDVFFKRWWYVLPLIFLFWANMHGGFAIGIAILLIASLFWYYKRKISLPFMVIVLLLCIGITGMTPYGFRMWWEVFMTMTDTHLHTSIQEWMPAFMLLRYSFWLFVVLSLIFVIKYRKIFLFFDLLLYFVFFCAAMLSIRNISLWLIVALSLTTQGIAFFYKEISAIPQGVVRFSRFFQIFFVVVCLFILPDFFQIFYGLGLFGGVAKYPDNAIHYLHHHLPKGQLFSTYDWGGYLIWKLPEKKVFIDGRMPSWRWQANLPGESNYAFSDYNNFLQGKFPFEKMTEKYHITALLLPRSNPDKKSTLLDRFDQVSKRIFSCFR